MSDHDQYLKAFGADVTRHIETVIEAARGVTPAVAGAHGGSAGERTSGYADHSGAQGHNERPLTDSPQGARKEAN